VQLTLARKSIDATVDALGHRVAIRAGEEIANHESDFLLGHHAGSHRAPQMRQREASQLLRLRALGESTTGFALALTGKSAAWAKLIGATVAIAASDSAAAAIALVR